MERITAAYQAFADVALDAGMSLSTYDDDFIKEIAMELLEAKESADFEFEQIKQLGEVMTLL